MGTVLVISFTIFVGLIISAVCAEIDELKKTNDKLCTANATVRNVNRRLINKIDELKKQIPKKKVVKHKRRLKK